MLVVRSDRLAAEAKAIRSLYEALTAAMDDSLAVGAKTTRQRALRHGLTDSLIRGVQVAIDFALEQEVIRTKLTTDELFADFVRYIGS